MDIPKKLGPPAGTAPMAASLGGIRGIGPADTDITHVPRLGSDHRLAITANMHPLGMQCSRGRLVKAVNGRRLESWSKFPIALFARSLDVGGSTVR